jgi:hypothetical protein
LGTGAAGKDRGDGMATVGSMIEGLRARRVRAARHEDALAVLVSDIVRMLDGPGRPSRAGWEAIEGKAVVERSHLNIALTEAEATIATLSRFAGPPLTARERLDLEAERRWTGAARRRLLHWRSVNKALQEAVTARSRPVYAEPATNGPDPASRVIRALAGSLRAMHAVANPVDQDAGARNGGAFPDIPLDPFRFAALALGAWRLCQAVRRRDRPRFLDVGCGGGLRVVQAAQIFASADGLEFDPGYARSARRLLKAAVPGRSLVHQADARSFDGYGEYDVIYFYRPMQDPAGLRALEDRILEAARPGTVLVTPYDGFEVRVPVASVVEHLQVVGLAANRATGLRRRAERIGCRMGDPGTPPPFALGYLTPLVDALARCGFAVE